MAVSHIHCAGQVQTRTPHLCMLPLQAGAQRLSALANLSHSGASAAIDGDAIPKLLHLLQHSDDQGAIMLISSLTLHFACCIFQPDTTHHAASSGDSRRPQLCPLPSPHCMGESMSRCEAGGDQCAAAAGQGSVISSVHRSIQCCLQSTSMRTNSLSHAPTIAQIPKGETALLLAEAPLICMLVKLLQFAHCVCSCGPAQGTCSASEMRSCCMSRRGASVQQGSPHGNAFAHMSHILSGWRLDLHPACR